MGAQSFRWTSKHYIPKSQVDSTQNVGYPVEYFSTDGVFKAIYIDGISKEDLRHDES
jgi:hypothetical protein